ncbi:MAG: hypothetical protein AAFP69_12780, partial [Planctomycetota bacterium]
AMKDRVKEFIKEEAGKMIHQKIKEDAQRLTPPNPSPTPGWVVSKEAFLKTLKNELGESLSDEKAEALWEQNRSRAKARAIQDLTDNGFTKQQAKTYWQTGELPTDSQ